MNPTSIIRILVVFMFAHEMLLEDKVPVYLKHFLVKSPESNRPVLLCVRTKKERDFFRVIISDEEKNKPDDKEEEEPGEDQGREQGEENNYEEQEINPADQQKSSESREQDKDIEDTKGGPSNQNQNGPNKSYQSLFNPKSAQNSQSSKQLSQNYNNPVNSQNSYRSQNSKILSGSKNFRKEKLMSYGNDGMNLDRLNYCVFKTHEITKNTKKNMRPTQLIYKNTKSEILLLGKGKPNWCNYVVDIDHVNWNSQASQIVANSQVINSIILPILRDWNNRKCKFRYSSGENAYTTVELADAKRII